MSASHQRALQELVSGLRRQESMLLLTGETGTGKTTICRAVLGSLGQRTFSALILNPYMSGAEMLRAILRDFGFVSRDDLRRGAFAQADVPQLLDALEGFLAYPVARLARRGGHRRSAEPAGRRARPDPAADGPRARRPPPDPGGARRTAAAAQTLKTEPMYALNERVTRRVTSSPLPSEEVATYIEHRLAVAGGTAVRSRRGGLTVADLSRGLPRRVNVLCDRALQEGRIRGRQSSRPRWSSRRRARSPACSKNARPPLNDRGRRAERQGREWILRSFGSRSLGLEGRVRPRPPVGAARARLRLLRARRRANRPGPRGWPPPSGISARR